MLKIEPTEHLRGARVMGDYDDLNDLHTALTDYLQFYEETTEYQEPDYEYLLALNYDLRKAYSGNRQYIPVRNNKPDRDLMDIDEEQQRELHHFTRYNLYYGVDIVAPLVLYYLVEIGNITADLTAPVAFERIDFEYDPLHASHDKALIDSFIAQIWIYLESVLGSDEASILYQYASMTGHRKPFIPWTYADAVSKWFMTTAKQLDETDMKSLILYTTYLFLGTENTTSKRKDMEACVLQYRKARDTVRALSGKPLPTFTRFEYFFDKTFHDSDAIDEDEFEHFEDQYFGEADWDSLIL